MTRTLLLAFLCLSLGCPKHVPDKYGRIGPIRSYRLLGAVLEKETSRFTQRRTDVEVDTHEYDRTPRIVAVGATPRISLEGAKARLYGDEAGTMGWKVDNFILLEVFTEGGQPYSTAVVGYAEGGVLLGKERVDNVGKMAFAFEPGEVDITSKLPENREFTVRATAMDYSGVGKVSDVYLVLEYPARQNTEEDLKGQ